jgi:[phosphatase 2A protein]-leucine-carboxy methyltransferase
MAYIYSQRVGTYVRTTAIDRLVTSFVTSHPTKSKQVLSLGAGKDTRYLRLASEFPDINFVYHELDFKANTADKIATIKATPDLLSIISKHSGSSDDIVIGKDNESFYSPSYNIHSIDLRSISTSNPPSLRNLDPSLPTLIISECCLCYLSPADNTKILEAFTQHYFPAPTPLGLIIYEPIRPNDSFGRVMVSNLASRGIVLQTLQKFENLAAQRSRLRTAGLTESQQAADINYIWQHWLDQKEKDRVARCEMLDEVEEWIMLAQHYCIVWGYREGTESKMFSEAWHNLPFQEDD